MRKARNIRFVCLAVLSVLSIVSCSKESPVQTGDTPIVFSARLDDDAATKGHITDAALGSFGVFTGFSSGEGRSATKEWTYMVNVPYSWSISTGTFDTDPARYWPVAGRLTFLAIAPYVESITGTMDFTGQGGYPSFLWAPDSDPEEQIDLCVAVNPDQTRQMEVPLCFHHATSQIRFAANCDKLDSSQFIIIDKIYVTDVIGEKRATVTDTPPYVEWESDAGLSRDAAYELSLTGGHLRDIRLPLSSDEPRGEEISTDTGSLFIVPQFSDIKITVKYGLYQDTGGGSAVVLSSYRGTTVVPRHEWNPDTKYLLLLTIHNIWEVEGILVQFTPYESFPEL